MKNINEMTRKEFEELPYRERFDSEIVCASLVILPTRRKHDSGYRCMDFVAVDAHERPICRCSGCSDVLHLYDWFRESFTKWDMDCLYKSGLLRVFSRENGNINVGAAVSDMTLSKKGE